jgi:hypothetical protein
MILMEAPLPEALLETVKNVEVANKVTHQVWREDNTLLGYMIRNSADKVFHIYPLREIDIGQLYAELDVAGFKNYSIDIINDNSLMVVDSIDKSEESLSLENLKLLKIARMKNLFESMKYRPRVQVTVGDPERSFYVDGSKDDISNFQSYLDLLLANGATSGEIKDADSIMQAVTTDELDSIIFQIKQHGLSLYQSKWVKEDEINNATTIDEVKAINIQFS